MPLPGITEPFRLHDAMNEDGRRHDVFRIDGTHWNDFFHFGDGRFGGHCHDELGNLTYRLAARNFNPIMAMAAKTTIAEVEENVPVGSNNPENVMNTAIFVHRIL